MFKNKILLITGGTGSFGTAVLNRFIDSDLKQIRIFSRDEKKQDDMRRQYKNKKLKFYIGDVRDKESITDAMYGVDYVFHAAALKQVPSCEFFPIEALKTNVLGTDNVIQMAFKHHVKKVIVLSTDKAVYPINVMGITKALMEKTMIANARLSEERGTVLCGTRYGNVMASRGSVIPHFVNQIKDGQEITITNPEMTRFMMTLDDAVNLVLHAFEFGQAGDIFVQKSPASTIQVLAEALKEIYKAENPIQVIGTRHGEKLYESLLSEEEMPKAQESELYFRIPADDRDLNYDKYFSNGVPIENTITSYHSHNTKRLNKRETIDLLLKLKEIQDDLSK
jgi:UDP-N-acetylglucosamine 4,6-dehydratase